MEFTVSVYVLADAFTKALTLKLIGFFHEIKKHLDLSFYKQKYLWLLVFTPMTSFPAEVNSFSNAYMNRK
jgi:hypothetical protein